MTFISRAKDAAKKLAETTLEAGQTLKKHVNANKDQWQNKAAEVGSAAKEATKAGTRSATEAARNFYQNIRYPKSAVHDLQNRIEAQGGFYRELNKNTRTTDSIFIGGESLATLLASGSVAVEIEAAYRAAYPNMSQGVSFEDKVRELEDDQLVGFVSGVKGKLFEQKYVEYLNDGNIPDGYTASLAGSATQPGWDIAIEGPNNEIASVLQAKATDSVSYVTDAIERYPNIDVVTTDEVYSHLVMSGVSEGIANGAISNADLADQLEKAVDASELSMDFTPPLFTLAFIAFTSYKEESLTLYEKARSAGGRSGKAYLSYLIGGGIAAVTNTWWLGVLASVASRYMSDEGLKKSKMIERLEETYKTNQGIIERIKRLAAAQPTVPGDGLASLGRP